VIDVTVSVSSTRLGKFLCCSAALDNIAGFVYGFDLLSSNCSNKSLWSTLLTWTPNFGPASRARKPVWTTF